MATTGKAPDEGAAERPDRGGVQVPPEAGLPAGPPAVRFGVLTRAAHVVGLSGLHMNLYAAAAQSEGWLEARLFERPAALVEAMEQGQLDLALLPLRDALQIYLKLGEQAPRVVAGAALGDEMYLLRKDVLEFDFNNLRPVRVTVLETPALDIRRALKLDSGAAPSVSLRKPDDLRQALASREVDLALAPEPLASIVAALSGSRVVRPGETEGGELLGGAVLVASAAFLREHEPLLNRLVMAHVVSATTVANDLDTAARRAIEFIGKAGLEAPALMFWRQGLPRLHFQSELPVEELAALLEVARNQGLPGSERELEGLLAPAILESVLRELEEGDTEQDEK